MGNSGMVVYTDLALTPSGKKHWSNRTKPISKITIHHQAGNLELKTCAKCFKQENRNASCNYMIDSNGNVGLSVEEKYRAWTSSNSANDNVAVTIEVANDEIGGQWHVSDKAYRALIELCVDICRRNNIKALIWTGDKYGTLTCHYMFSATECPGAYLKSRMSSIALEVTKRLADDAEDTINNGASNETNKTDIQTGIQYVVKRGDTLSDIAMQYNTTVDAIMKMNGIRNKNLIIAGQILNIPMKQPSGTQIYIVKKGDTLSDIAIRYNTTVDKIVKTNGLKDKNLIVAGQKITV